MNITTLWHQILTEIQTLLHIHPSHTQAVAQKKTEIATLADHPGLLPEQKEAVKTMTETAAAVVPEPVPAPVVPSAAPAEPTTAPATAPAPAQNPA